MTVKELKDKLENMMADDPATAQYTVVMSMDAEGNDYGELADMDQGYFYKGEWGHSIVGENDWDEYEDDKPFPGNDSLVFWPV